MSASVSDISRSSLLALSLSVVAEGATTMAPESPPAPVNATASPSNVAPVLPMQFNPALALVVLVIIICFFLAALATTFLKRFARPGEADTEDAVRRRSRSRTGGPTSKSQCGLDPEILEALPRVHYKDLPADEQVQKYLDCPVCLAPFDADDTLRLLPVCSHAFHSGCVDAWFLSHNTCPLCRACLALPMGKESREERGDNAENGEQIEISVSEGFDVAEVVIDGDTEQDRSGSAAISGFLPDRIGGAALSNSRTVEKEEERVHALSLRQSNAGGSFRPAVQIVTAPEKAAALPTIRRSNSVDSCYTGAMPSIARALNTTEMIKRTP